MTKQLLYLFLTILLPYTGSSQLDYDDFKDTQYFLKASDDPNAIINNNIFIQATCSKRSCYVNEPILIDYKLYTRLRSQSRVVKQPTFTGGSVAELTPKEQVSYVEKINGKLYKVYLIRSVQFTPLQPGNITLGTVAVENKISLMKPGLNNPYDGEVIERIKTIQNTDIVLQVKELPTANKPTAFNGSIGQFSINTYTDTNTIGKDELAVFIVSIKGAGNLKSIVLPKIEWPDGVEVFEMKTTENVSPNSFPPQGEKIFAIPFQYNRTGKLNLPTVQFSYFDTETSTYETFETKPLSIDVVASNTKPMDIDDTNPAVDLSNKKYLWIVAGIALLAFSAWWWNGRKLKAKEPINTTVEPILPTTLHQEALINFEQHINELIKQEDNQFIEKLVVNFKGFLLQQCQLPFDASVSTNELLAALKNNSIGAETIAEIKAILDDCHLAAYTPVKTIATDFKLKDRVQHVIASLKF
jgi:hypothetical protein